MTGASALRRNPALAEIDQGHRSIILALDAADCAPCVLSGSGLLIWRAITDRPTKLSELAQTIATQTGMPKDVIEPDILSFTTELIVKGLLVECADPSAD